MPRPAHQPSPPGRNRPRPALRLEALEDRCLLSAPAPLPAYDPTQILVQFRPGALPGPSHPLDVPGASIGPQLDIVPGLYEVRLPGLSVPQAVALFQADPRVLSARPDYYVTVTGTPNDSQFGSEWGMANTGQSGGTAGVDVHATQAWDVTTGGAGVTVGLIDTGVDYDHPDLYQNIWINQAEIPNSWYTKSADGTFDQLVLKSQIKTATPGVITFADLNSAANKGLGWNNTGPVWDNNGDGRIDAADLLRPLAQGGWDANSTKDGDTAHPDDFFGWNFVAKNNNPFDDDGHGTNVAGIVGATGNNGVGVAGLDWNARLMALKAFDSTGYGAIGDILAAIEYSIQHGAKISNNSWALLNYSQDLLNAIGDARAAGQIFVVAAGNGGSSVPDFPATFTPKNDNMISVAAVDSSGQLWSNSDYGAAYVTLAAPGVNIQSTAPGGGYDAWTGTSQAVPFVAGTLALVWGEHPDWTYKQVIAQVTSTVTPLASLKGKTITGGMVNAASAVGAVTTNGGPVAAAPPHVLTTVFSGPDAFSLNRVVVTFDQLIDPTTFTAANVRLTNPAGQTVTLTAAKLAPGSDGHQFEIDFATQSTAGAYTLALGAGVRGILGGSLAPVSIAHTITPAAYTFASTQATPIPWVGSAVSSITVNQNLPIASVKVVLNITFPTDDALFIMLQAPDGTQIWLDYGRNAYAHNLWNTVLDDTASQPLSAGSGPFTGSYRPDTPLSVLKGKNANGVWKLVVEDRKAGGTGVLTNWSLIVTRAAPTATAAGEPADHSAADAAFTSLR